MLHMLLQVKTCPVSMADTLDPALTGVYLCIPTVARLVRHLSAQVLSEPDVLFLDAHFEQELLGFDHELGDCAVRN